MSREPWQEFLYGALAALLAGPAFGLGLVLLHLFGSRVDAVTNLAVATLCALAVPAAAGYFAFTGRAARAWGAGLGVPLVLVAGGGLFYLLAQALGQRHM